MSNTDKAAREDAAAIGDASAGADEERLAHLERTLRLRYLGLGFIWAWIYGSFETSAVYPDRAGIGINADASWIVSAAAVALSLFAIGAALGRRVAAPAWLAPAAAIGSAAGTLLSALFPTSFFLGVLTSGLLTGIGTATLTVLWGQALTRLGRETAELAVPASSVVMLAGSLVFPYLPPTVGMLAAASLLLASGAALMLTTRDLAAREAAAPDAPPFAAHRDDPTAPVSGTGRPSGTIARIAALLFLAYGALCCAEALQGPDAGAFIAFGIDWPVIIGSCGGIVLMVAFLLYSARPSFDALFRLMVPLVTAGVALLPWADLWAVFAASVCLSVANTVLTIAAMLAVVTAAQSGRVNPALGTGITQGALQAGVLAGNAFSVVVPALAGSSATGLFAISLGLLAFLSLSWLAYPADRECPRGTRDNDMGGTSPLRGGISDGSLSLHGEASSGYRTTRAVPANPVASGGNTATVEGFPHLEAAGPSAAALDERCRALTEIHGLSAREAEILGYLARGRSQPYIRDELVLSKNTVATHVKHIYQKLNVHSRQELLDLFE